MRYKSQFWFYFLIRFSYVIINGSAFHKTFTAYSYIEYVCHIPTTTTVAQKTKSLKRREKEFNEKMFVCARAVHRERKLISRHSTY